ncbi:MAG: HAD family hydrolase [Deltaproteobacteria bacterium]
MKKYGAALFDLFDTVVSFDRARIETVQVNGSEMKSTSRAVYSTFQRFYRGVGFEAFYEAFVGSYVEFNEIKERDLREYPNRQRFGLMLRGLGIQSANDDEAALAMTSSHMEGIAAGVYFPEENREVLQKLSRRYRIALVSNFDHAETAYSLLRKFDIERYFEQMVISIEFGWRKPKPDIFRHALERLGVAAEDSVFVGDNFDADVRGSKSVGMDAVWINKFGEQTPEEKSVEPDYTVLRFADIRHFLL